MPSLKASYRLLHLAVSFKKSKAFDYELTISHSLLLLLNNSLRSSLSRVNDSFANSNLSLSFGGNVKISSGALTSVFGCTPDES